MSATTAAKLQEGDVIDLEPILAALVPGWDADGVDPARYELATVESVTPAESVNGVAAVLLSTDQHNVKIPAALVVAVEKGEGA